jgi:hypothetical protein
MAALVIGSMPDAETRSEADEAAGRNQTRYFAARNA